MTKRNLIGLVILCSVVLTAGACGTKKADKAGAKAGAKSGAAGLVGTWKINAEKLIASDEKMRTAPKARQQQFIAMINKATVTITKDTISIDGMGPKDPEKYKVIEDKGKTVILETSDKEGKPEKSTYTFISGNEVKVFTHKNKETIFITRK